jgi:hypothetical protein
MEYLITMAVFLLVVTCFLTRWGNSFSEKAAEKFKEIQPPVKAEDKGNSFSPPEGKAGIITRKGHPLGEGVYGYIEGYVTDDGTAYALTVFNRIFYRCPVKELYREFPEPEGESSNTWCEWWAVTATAGNPMCWNSKEAI